MKVAAIISEYNPFHLGHEYQINEVKKRLEADYVIAVMSGNYVQRGEPAIFNKWLRTNLALRGGADLIIELPTPFASSSAELFSKGAVNALNQLGIVDYLCFGSEIGELEPLKSLATFLNNEPANYKNALQSELRLGHSYPRARYNAVNSTFTQNSHFLKGSNNILAIEYLRALEISNSNIKPTTIKRVGASYLSESLTEVLPSASAIRHHIHSNSHNSSSVSGLESALPSVVLSHLLHPDKPLTPLFMKHLYPYLRYLLAISDAEKINLIYDFPQDLFQRLSRASRNHAQYTDFLEAAGSKNYTKTTLQRSLLHLFLNIRQSDIDIYANNQYNQYTRVLGFRKNASKLLQKIQFHSSLPLITNFKDHQRLVSPLGKEMLLKEATYTQLYNQLIFQTYHQTSKDDYTQPIIIV